MSVRLRPEIVAAAVLAFGFAAFPLFPAFITLAAVTPPGVSLVPRRAAIALLLVCVLAALAMVATLIRVRAPVPAGMRSIAIYIGGWLVAALFGFDPATGLLFVVDGLFVAVFHWGIARFYRERGVATAVLAAFLASGAIVSLLGLAMVAIRRPAVLFAVEHGRATATFVVPGEFAGYLLFLIPLAAGTFIASRRPALRLLAAVAALGGLVALGATYSRAGWIGFAVGCAFCAFMLRRSVRSAVLIVGALVLGAAAIAVFNGHHNPSEYFTRVAIWIAGLRTIELFPLTGVGPGAFRLVYPALRPPGAEPTAFHVHSYVLTSFAETGLVGMATLVAMWWAFAQRFGRALGAAQGRRRILALAVASGFIATWTQGALDFVQVTVLGCWIPFMALAVGAAEHGVGEP
ncbi:MAG: O-antigen ligase family protein [Candidatus Baltobacteraceae bacterium]